MQGARIFRNEAYLIVRWNEDEAQRSRWTF